MRLLYTSFCLLLLQGAFAQRSLTYVFPIYAAEVEELHRADAAADIDFLLDRQPVDTLGSEETPGQYPTGHYLLVRAREERLEWTLHSESPHQVFVRTVAKAMVVNAVDAAGRPVLPTRVILDGQPLTPHPADSTFRRKTYRGDWLRVELPADTLFFSVTEQYRRSRFSRRLERWGQTSVVRLLSTPYRWVRNTVRYVRRGLRYGRWRPYTWPGERLYRRLFDSYRPDFRGYIATNQPIYRPGDTLHLVAYATKHRGRPLRRKLNLAISNYQNRLIDTLLRPVTPGRYVYTTVVGDSAKLDQDYYVTLSGNGANDYRSLGARIHIEAYELDEYRLSSSAPDRFEDHEPVAIAVTAGDINGLPVVGSELELLLTSKGIQAGHTDRFVLPDTLWRQRFAMDDRTDFTVLIPDSLFPPAHLALAAELRYTGPSGQQRVRRHSFIVVREPAAPRIRFVGDSLLLTATDLPTSAEAELCLQYPGALLRCRQVGLPQRLPVNPAVQQYTLHYRAKRADLHVNREPDRVAVGTTWRHDSLLLHISNPYGLPVDWSIRRPDGVFLTGTTAARVFRDTLLVDLDRTQLWLAWSYPWAGAVKQEERSIYNAANELDVRLSLPGRAYPGQTVPVTVAVADQRGRPQAAVPVAMGSYNARFEKSPYTVPEINQRGRREPLAWQQFSASPFRSSGTDSLRMHWVVPLQLHDSTFYRMLLPQAAWHPEYIPLARKEQPDTSLAQVSPYLVRRGQRESVHLVYLDHRLVYFANANGATPYAFVSTPGYHHLTLRTDRAEYQLDRVELRAGHRLILSLDTDRLAEVGGGAVTTRPAQLTEAERAQLRRQLFVLRSLPASSRRASAYLWQDSTRVFALQGWRAGTWCGIFTPGGPLLRIHLADGPTLSARFEPGYQYAIEADRDRLYAYDIAPDLEKINLASRSAKPAFGPSALFPSQLPQRPRRDSIWWVPFDRVSPDRQPGAARLALAGLPESLYRLVLTRGDSIERVTTPVSRLGQLPPDRYRVWLLYPDQTGQAFSVTLAANQTLFLAIDSAGLRRRALPPALVDSLGSDWRTIIPRPDSRQRVIRQYVPGQFKISGYIRDASGEPLIGASVLVQGTTQGTVTDFDGYYELMTMTLDPRLVISYTGFATQEVETGPGEHLEIALEEDSAMLEEVVVTGLSSKVSGVRVRGSRSGATAFSIDGVRTGSPGEPEGIARDQQLPQYDGPRTAFRDYAAWRPLLLTDRAGKVDFTVTLPDDITAWNSFALATDHRKAGLGLARTQVYLPLQAQLYLPRFLVAGDQSEAIGLAVNRTGAALRITPYFGLAGAVRAGDPLELATGEELRFPITAPPGNIDSLTYTFEVRGADFGDGEQRSFPVFRRGTVTTAGWFRPLDTAFAEIDFAFDPAGDSVSVQIYGNRLAQLENELAHLRDYPYLCHEQTASRLIALLAYVRIQYARREVDPDLVADIRAMLQRLEQGRNADGGWGWWPGGGSSPWISMHAERAFRQARRLGWAGVPDSTATYRYLQATLPALQGTERLAALLFFAEADLTLDYAAELSLPDSSYRVGRHEWFLRTRIRQLAGLPYTLDTLAATRQRTMTGADYWGETGHCGYAPYRRTLANNLLAYQLLRDTGQVAAAERARRYVLERRFSPQRGTLPRLGQNTYESALLIHELLPELLAEDEELRPASAELRTATGREIAVAKTPHSLQLSPAEAQQLSWRKQGAGPLFLSAFQRRFESDPPVRAADFQLRTTLWQEEQPVDRLRTGIPATLRATVTVRADADYVLIELPIPAGCSYGEKVFGEGRYESYREYRRDRVAIFCTRLPAGEYAFTVPLEPRFRGRYQLNPARAEMMYLPVFNGNNRVGEVAVE